MAFILLDLVLTLLWVLPKAVQKIRREGHAGGVFAMRACLRAARRFDAEVIWLQTLYQKLFLSPSSWFALPVAARVVPRRATSVWAKLIIGPRV